MRIGKDIRMTVSKPRKNLAIPIGTPRRKTHFVSMKLVRRIRPEKGGYGVFAAEDIAKGTLLVVWGGTVMTLDELASQSQRARRHSLQVEENLYLVNQDLPEVGDYINHSCSPNVGMAGQTALIAMRDIHSREEICYDYAMSDGSPYDEFLCSCQSPLCRGVVTGSDWMILDLQERYRTYFSPYLQRRIAALQESQNSSKGSFERERAGGFGKDAEFVLVSDYVAKNL